MKTLALFVIGMSLLATIHGHGTMIDPPSRASMWRYGFDTPANYNDNQMFCGGFSVQWNDNGGKCGVCGDNYSGLREHEGTGKYSTGIRVKNYTIGAELPVTIHLSANHKGYFEFRLCQNDVPQMEVDQSCFDRNLLSDTTGRSRHPVSMGDDEYLDFKLMLPQGLRCKDCVLQWKYNAGNSWGVAPNGTGCVGCGPQEQFYACSDIVIGHPEVELGKIVKTVPVPPGGVDERTAWEEKKEKEIAEHEAEIEAAVAKRVGNCSCSCTSGGSSPIPHVFETLSLLLLNICSTLYLY